MIPNELLPRPAMRIGITGRRALEIKDYDDDKGRITALDRTEHVRQLVSDVLYLIVEAAKSEFKKAAYFYQEKEPEFRAISPIAEGADRIFAEQAVKHGYLLECPLPFQRDEYRRDFSTAESKEAFDQLLKHAGEAVLELNGQRVPKTAESAAYECVGRLVVDQCDLLIAVWDGETDDGPGGTYEIMQFASGRVPTICLRMDEDSHTIHHLHGRRRPEPYSPVALTKLVESILAPPTLSSDKADESDFRDTYHQKASTKQSLLGRVWKIFIRSMLLGKNKRQKESEHVPRSPFLPYYERFDRHAMWLSGLYRGAFLVNYMLGVLAVIFALVGFAAYLERESLHAASRLELVFVGGEFVAIFCILEIGRRLRKNRWHYRSVDCRYLGEQFRVLCYLHTLGLAPPRPRLPAHRVQHDVQKSWMEWLLRGILRQTPMTEGLFTENSVEDARKRLLGWVRGQIRYHHTNAGNLEIIDYRLRFLMWGSLVVILMSCACHLVLHESHLSELHKQRISWLLMALAAGLPTFSAACHAVATQGEFEQLAERSNAMCESLEALAEDLNDIGNSDGFVVGDLRETARAVSELVVEEIVDWQILYRKPIPPP